MWRLSSGFFVCQIMFPVFSIRDVLSVLINSSAAAFVQHTFTGRRNLPDFDLWFNPPAARLKRTYPSGDVSISLVRVVFL
jgi:hypothetical protein